MTYWRSLKFWAYCGGFAIPSLFLCSPPLMFIKSRDPNSLKVFALVAAWLALAFLLTWRLARDAALWDEQRSRRKTSHD